MMEPERRDVPERPAPLSPAERSRVTRAAALRPLNVIVLVIGGVFFAATQAWWMVPLTLVTYALLVFFASRDPIFTHRVLHDDHNTGLPAATSDRDISPERRARWLARGETREKVEAALIIYRKVVVAIEESDEVTRAVLDDAVPKLHAAANRLVDVAQRREKAAEVLHDLRRHATVSPDATVLQDTINAADAEISGTLESLLALRSRVVRVSIDSGNPERAATLNASLDDLNARLEALSETMSPPARRDR
jgi:hypothetical protein